MTVCGIKHADGVCVMGKCPYIKMCCPAVWDKRNSEPQTNEEWLRTLPADERVKEILNRGFMTEERTTEEFVEWLKEKHNG